MATDKTTHRESHHHAVRAWWIALLTVAMFAAIACGCDWVGYIYVAALAVVELGVRS